MFLINKASSSAASASSSSRRSSRDFASPDHDSSSRDVNMEAPDTVFKPKPKERRLRARTSLFGKELTVGIEEREIPPSLSRNPSLKEKGSTSSLGSGPRRRLRKVGSKTSLISFASSQQSPIEEKPPPKSRALAEQFHLFRSGQKANEKALTRPKAATISQPFNFTHLSHHSPRDAPHIRPDAQEVGEEWNRALERESQLRPLTAKISLTSLRSPGASTTRSRADSVKSISPVESPPSTPPQQEPQPQLRHACPITPPVRSSSRHCLRILEQPEEEGVEQLEPELNLNQLELDVEEDEVGTALTTVGDSSYGRKSVGIEKLLINPTSAPTSVPATPDDDKPATAEIPDADEIAAGPERVPEPETREPPSPTVDATTSTPPKSRLLTVKTRPLSQLSQVSDTLNGTFVVPPSPAVGVGRHGSMRGSRRVSRRMSIRHTPSTPTDPDATAALDSWMEDIDWCYEHAAEADCDFDWDRSSEYLAAEPEPESERESEAETTPSALSPPSQQHLNKIPESPTKPNERRITGLFEDRLLLPPTPTTPAFNDDPTLTLRARNNRSTITSSPSLPDLVHSRSTASYREELCRVAQQLDEHIAALNRECHFPPVPVIPPIPPRPEFTATSTTSPPRRIRANSEATTATVMTAATESEVVTPASSAHNSVQFSVATPCKARANSVLGAGMAVDLRGEKGLSFPAAAIPGVVELSPEVCAGMTEGKGEFMSFI